MTVFMIACSRQGYELMKKVEQKWTDVSVITKVKCKSLPELTEAGSLGECIGEWFGRADAIVFFCAAGIAVRGIAPFIGHKSKDPAVLVIDEKGSFCISLLSGHAGGANELAGRLAEMTGAIPVITTATDLEHKFAVDEFARKNNLVVTDWKLAKEISADILEGKRIGFYSDLPVEGEIPGELFCHTGLPNDGLESRCSEETGIYLSYRKTEKEPFYRTLHLVPKVLAIGIGCRRGVPKERIEGAVTACLAGEHILPEAVCTMASIDLKKQEKGILDYCRERNLPFQTFTAQQLDAVEGEYGESDFVRQVTGVSNVCERSAAAAGGRLICTKKVYDGVTIAIAEKKGSIQI